MELYIAPNGDDKARGTLDTPLKTLSAAVKRMAAAEDGYWDGRAEIILRGGVYPVDKTIDIATNMPLTIRACTGEEAVLDGGRVIENLTELEDDGEVYESIEDIWPDYPTKDDFFFNEEEY